MNHTDVTIVIPAYKPDARMNQFIIDLRALGFERLLVVDDGGGPEFLPFFEQAQADGARVLAHEANRGKGAALKTAFAHLLSEGPTPVITADCDGQHSPKDVLRMAGVLLDSPGAMVLGTRDKSMMPFRSKFGNTTTCAVLGLLTGLWIDDTQTGLRALPLASLSDFASLEGDRYEYEMNMLIQVRQLNMPVVQMTIDTIYIDDNKSSHFDTIKDSFRIYSLLFKQIGKYVGSSLVSAVVEYFAFVLLHFFYPAEHQLLISVVGARIISSALNYFINREMVFKSRAGRRSLVYFYVLVSCVLAVDYAIVRQLTYWGMSAYVAKPIADLLLFILSYNVQQRYVFRDRVAG